MTRGPTKQELRKLTAEHSAWLALGRRTGHDDLEIGSPSREE
jgi:hypothetical protein